MQEYWRQKGAHSCFCTIQDIHEFFEWLANRLVHLKNRQKAFVKAQQYVAKLAEFQGYVSWNHRQDDHVQRLRVSMQRKQGVITVITRPATNRNRFALTRQQVERLVEEVSWDKACADDTIPRLYVSCTMLFVFHRDAAQSAGAKQASASGRCTGSLQAECSEARKKDGDLVQRG